MGFKYSSKILTHLIKLNNVGVVEPFHDVHLAIDLLQVASIQLGFIYYFNSHLKNENRKQINLARKKRAFLFLN